MDRREPRISTQPDIIPLHSLASDHVSKRDVMDESVLWALRGGMPVAGWRHPGAVDFTASILCVLRTLS